MSSKGLSARITRSFLKALPAAGNQRRVWWDQDVKGLAIGQSPRGKVVFFLQSRLNGKQVSKKIGDYPAMMPEEAREIASRIKSARFHDRDILAEMRAESEAPTDITFRQMAEEFETVHTAKKRAASGNEDKRKIRMRLNPRWGDKLVKDISAADIEKLHVEMKDTPVEANRILALLSSLFNYAIRIGIRPDNPVKDIKKYQEVPRQRYLSKDETKRLKKALDKRAATYPDTVNALYFVMDTGCRRGEMISALWDQFDFDTNTWTKPATATKQKMLHRIPLSDGALAVLKAQRQAYPKARPKDFIFSPALAREGFLMALRRLFAKVCEEAKLTDFHIHDLRHSFASTLVASGANLPTVGALLGHNNPRTTARYSHLADEALRAALKRRDEAQENRP